jgi:hypothetical protein
MKKATPAKDFHPLKPRQSEVNWRVVGPIIILFIMLLIWVLV